VLSAVEDSGRADDTVVIATADHGEMLSAHRMYQKGVLYDESCHIPFMVSTPGVAPGRRATFGSHVDMPSTVTDLLALPSLPDTQGRSLAPVLASEQGGGADEAFVEFNGYMDGGIHTRGIVTKDWKYVYHHGDRDQLFSRVSDPHEMTDLSGNPKHVAARNQMRQRLAAWMRQTGDFVEPVWPD
jgi:arylsulfatase A-like enzyme